MTSDDDRPRYHSKRKRNGNAFWEPGKFAEQFGLPKSAPLGPYGPDSFKKAIEWNEKLDAAREAKRKGEQPKQTYPDGTLGAFYEWFQTREAWGQMEPRTREDYGRAWPHIEKRFALSKIHKLSADDSERFHVEVHPAHRNKRDPEGKLKLPWNTAHRVLKVWRSLLTALVSYQLRPAPPPIGRVTNPRPPGRDAIWLHEEVMELIKAGGELGLDGPVLAIRIAWDAMLSPWDAFALPIGGFREAVEEVRTTRQKSKRKVYVAVSPETAEAGRAYLRRLEAAGIALEPDAPLIRNKQLAPYSGPHAKKYFERDFRAIRQKAFPGDRRQMLDLRRSAITEGRMGGATLDDLGTTAANNLATDEVLQSTYALAASKKVRDARDAGRKALAKPEAFRNDAE